jgi:ABC-type Mn2+/Zn2+ transport system ATPase subunit
MPVLEATRLDVGYEGAIIVGDVHVSMPRGASLALVGANGSGKSTLLRTVVGLLRPIGGSVHVLDAPPKEASGAIGYLSQFHTNSLVLPLRVVDVVRMARYDRRRHLQRLGADDHALVHTAIARMGVAHLADAPLRALSGGQQQRIHLAQVLARRADLLVLDEPTAGLDAGGREAYLVAMEDERARGATIVTATHDIGEASVCDHVMLLAGRVVAEGAPAEVLTPEHLLATFGIGLTRVGDHLVVAEEHHRHQR